MNGLGGGPEVELKLGKIADLLDTEAANFRNGSMAQPWTPTK